MQNIDWLVNRYADKGEIILRATVKKNLEKQNANWILALGITHDEVDIFVNAQR